MGSPESDIHTPEPRDEFRKTRLGMLTSGSKQDIGFTNFRLAQKVDIEGKKLGRASYGVNLQNKTGNEKQEVLLMYLTQYISDIELGPVEIDDRGIFDFDKDPDPDKRKKILEKIIQPCIQFFNKIEDKFKEFKDIQYFSIDKGVFSFGVIIPPSKDTQVLNINLSSVFAKSVHGEFLFDEKKMDQELQGKTHQSLDSLKQSLDTGSFFGGTVIITYEKIDTTKKFMSNSLMIASGLDITYRVAKFMFRDENGKMQEVDPKVVRDLLKGIGDKTRINTMIFRIMRQIGKGYNPIRSAFTDMTTLGIDRATERVKRLKRADIEQGRNMTDAEFETEKTKMIQELVRTPRSIILQKAGEFSKGVLGKLTEYIFWGVFFAEYHKNTYDTANLYKGFAETGLFYAGVNVGGRVAPGVWKMPASLIGGGLAIAGGHMVGGAMNLDKKVWRAMPDRVSGDGTKSVASHVVFGGASNDLADKANIDIGIPGTRGGAVVYNPLGKDGIMPNIDFAGTHITFGTDSREYLQSRIGGTDVHWNKRMDEYVSWATDTVMKVLYEYDQGKGYFSSGNGDKNTLLRERLKDIFDAEGGKNTRNSMVIEDCIDFVNTKLTKVKDLNARKELLSIFLGNYGNILKIDEASLKYDETLLERDKSLIDSRTLVYMNTLSSEKRNFAQKIFDRLQKGERLVDGKVVTRRGDMIGQEVSVFVSDKKELDLYRGLIDDPTPVSKEWYDMLGYKEPTIDFQNIAFSLPDKRVKIGDKLLYLRSHFDGLLSEYIPILTAGNKVGIAELDRKYNINTLAKSTKDGKPISTIAFRSILLESLCNTYPEVTGVILDNKYLKSPTLGDAFVHLLNTQTEYREQHRFVDTQKKIGYANKWKWD